jgi:hypothetical protein
VLDIDVHDFERLVEIKPAGIAPKESQRIRDGLVPEARVYPIPLPWRGRRCQAVSRRADA